MSNEKDIPIPKGFEVYWEPWVDAYNLEEMTDLLSDILEENDEDTDTDINLKGINENHNMELYSTPIKTIITPFGVLPLTENSLASSHFKFWIGHVNFRLLESYYDLLDNCDGVESVDFLTPYRFRIAIGKLFKDREVMHNVRKTLLRNVNNESKE